MPLNAALADHTDVYFRGYDQTNADFWLFKEWEREFDQYVANDNLPNLQFVRFPHDHFGNFGTAIDGVNTVETQMADNDYAVGLLIEKVAKSKYKDNTLIFVIEDDAQNGGDHVDAHRSIALIAGSVVRRGALVSTHYTTVSMIRTIVDVLGIEPAGLNDALAEPMADVFKTQAEPWTYTAMVPAVLYSTQLPLPAATAANRQRDQLGPPCRHSPCEAPTIGSGPWRARTSSGRTTWIPTGSMSRCGPGFGVTASRTRRIATATTCAATGSGCSSNISFRRRSPSRRPRRVRRAARSSVALLARLTQALCTETLRSTR